MCCFSQPVADVSNTNVIVRGATGARQFLVYAMSFVASEELAMVLPLPVPPQPPEDAVRFISLEACPDFFETMARGFPEEPFADGVPAGLSLGFDAPVRTLEVHSVGDFEASFVPTLADFGRLDPRFRLPSSAWEQVPQYADYGFAVFKLRSRGESVTVHPMAFEFPRRDPSGLFVPAVHIHDGRYRSLAHYDHALYCQADERVDGGFEVSSGLARSFMDVDCLAQIVDGDALCFRQTLRGTYRNADLLIRRGANGRVGLRFEGSSEHAALSGAVDELAEALISEVLLNHPDEVEQCRAKYATGRDASRRSTRSYNNHDREALEFARIDLRYRLEKQLERARESFTRSVELPLPHAAARFQDCLERGLGSALNAWL
jgi:hypothetical protein